MGIWNSIDPLTHQKFYFLSSPKKLMSDNPVNKINSIDKVGSTLSLFSLIVKRILLIPYIDIRKYGKKVSINRDIRSVSGFDRSKRAFF